MSRSILTIYWNSHFLITRITQERYSTTNGRYREKFLAGHILSIPSLDAGMSNNSRFPSFYRIMYFCSVFNIGSRYFFFFLQVTASTICEHSPYVRISIYIRSFHTQLINPNSWEQLFNLAASLLLSIFRSSRGICQYFHLFGLFLFRNMESNG